MARYVGADVDPVIASADLRAIENPALRAAFDALCRAMLVDMVERVSGVRPVFA